MYMMGWKTQSADKVGLVMSELNVWIILCHVCSSLGFIAEFPPSGSVQCSLYRENFRKCVTV